MNKFFLTAITILLVQLTESTATTSVDTINVSPFGRVYVYNPVSTSTNVVIMISGDGGWKSGVVSFAEEFFEDE